MPAFRRFAGFFSKDVILWARLELRHTTERSSGRSASIAAGFTSFYMFRLLILTFFGTPRYTHDDVHHVHESPASMLIPLVVLALLSIVAGFVGVPPYFAAATASSSF